MKSIKFANGRQLEILECYNHGMKYIQGETRNTREIVLADSVIGLDELKALLANSDNLSVIEVTMDYVDENGQLKTDTEVLGDFVYTDEIKDKMNGEIRFTIGEKSALEIENQQAMETIDTLLIAMEV